MNSENIFLELQQEVAIIKETLRIQRIKEEKELEDYYYKHYSKEGR